MSKLNRLITSWPDGSVYTSSYLSEQGYSPALIAQYKKSGWVKSLGKGAIAKKGDSLDWRGGLLAIQKQLDLEIHVGAKSALRMHGASHFISDNEQILLFGTATTRLPNWFKTTDWKQQIKYFSTKLFKSDIGILHHKSDTFGLKVSSRERALFEQLSLVPQFSSFRDSAYLFQGLYTLRGDLIQNLLLECTSIKTKRLFMVVAEKLAYPWVKKLDLSKVDFGSGNRLIDRGGVTDQKYNITTEPLDFLGDIL